MVRLTERHGMRGVSAQCHSPILIIPRFCLPDVQSVFDHRRIFRYPLDRTLVRFRPSISRNMRLQSLQSIRLIIVVLGVLQRPSRQDLERPRSRIIDIWHIEHIRPDVMTCRMYGNVNEGM